MRLPFAFQIRDLSGNQLQRAGGAGQFQDDGLVRIAGPALAPGGDFKGLGQQGVAGQHRNALAEDLVVGQFAAPVIVVVHGGKVVVDQRIGVDALDGAGQRQGVGFVAAAGRGGGQAQGGADAFAAGKQRVAHGAVDGGRFGRRRGQEPIQGPVNGRGARGQKILQVKRAVADGRTQSS